MLVFKKKKKDKKVTVSYKHRVLSFKTLKKNPSQPRGLNIRSQPDQAHVASGQVHCCFVAQRASTPPPSRI